MKEMIDSIYKSYINLPERLPNTGNDFLPFDDCLKIVWEAADNVSKDDIELYQYQHDHIWRFAHTLSRIPKAKKGEVILEIGSFSLFSLFLQKYLGYQNIIGIDKISNTGKVQLRTEEIAGYKYTQQVYDIDLDADESKLPPDIKVDKIIFTEVLEHLWKPVNAFKKFHSLLKPGGGG